MPKKGPAAASTRPARGRAGAALRGDDGARGFLRPPCALAAPRHAPVTVHSRRRPARCDAERRPAEFLPGPPVCRRQRARNPARNTTALRSDAARDAAAPRAAHSKGKAAAVERASGRRRGSRMLCGSGGLAARHAVPRPAGGGPCRPRHACRPQHARAAWWRTTRSCRAASRHRRGGHAGRARRIARPHRSAGRPPEVVGPGAAQAAVLAAPPATFAGAHLSRASMRWPAAPARARRGEHAAGERPGRRRVAGRRRSARLPATALRPRRAASRAGHRAQQASAGQV
jgi:hypothetical protein